MITTMMRPVDDDRVIEEYSSLTDRVIRVGKQEFVRRWVSHARQLELIGIDVIEEVQAKAGAEWEMSWAAQNRTHHPGEAA